MKRSLLFAACISALLLLAGCSNPSDETKETPVVDMSDEDKAAADGLKLDTYINNSKSVMMIDIGKSYMLGLSDSTGKKIQKVSDIQLSCTDRNVVEIYNDGFIAAKEIGTAKITAKSASQNIDVTFNVYVIKRDLKQHDSYNEFTVDIPDGIGIVNVYRIEGDDEVIVGQIDSLNKDPLKKGTYKFKDYFVTPESDVDYELGIFESTNYYGWGWRYKPIKCGSNTKGPLTFNPTVTNVDVENGKITITNLPAFNKPEGLKERYRVYFYTSADKEDCESITLSELSSTLDLSKYNFFTEAKGSGIKIYGIGLAAWLYDETTYDSTGIYWLSDHNYRNPKLVYDTVITL